LGHTYHDIASLPAPGTVVWCKYPKNEKGPAKVSRPVLVRKNSTFLDPQGMTYGAVKVTYGTSKIEWCDQHLDFIVSDPAEWRSLGLHKATGFHLAPSYTKNLIWCEEYFAPPPYVLNTPITIGRLSPELVARFKECVARRGG
jgi:hypothetical protein